MQELAKQFINTMGIIKLPSKHQIGDKVLFSINQGKESNPMMSMHILTCQVRAVHFYPGKVKYDLEIPLAGEISTRIYNIDSCFVESIE